MTEFVSDSDGRLYDESERVTLYISVRGPGGAGKDLTLAISATELRVKPLAPVTLATLASFARGCIETARDRGSFGGGP